MVGIVLNPINPDLLWLLYPRGGGVESTTLNYFWSRGAMIMKIGTDVLNHEPNFLEEKKFHDVIQKSMTSSPIFQLLENLCKVWFTKYDVRTERVEILRFCFQILKDNELLFKINAGFLFWNSISLLKSMLNMSKIS